MSAGDRVVHTLLLRLAGPMQAWGTQSVFPHRDTGQEPSKSGVLGLVCAALGRERREPIADLAALRLGVRVDREGTMALDYQTAGGTHLAGDAKRYGVAGVDGGLRTVVTPRAYLADADFLVGLEGPDLGLLTTIDDALRRPCWPLFLGRKAFPPGKPVAIPPGEHGPRGIREGKCVEDALQEEPWPPVGAGRTKLRCVIECDPAKGDAVRLDQPLAGSFDPDHADSRRFLPRSVVVRFREPAAILPDEPATIAGDHQLDPDQPSDRALRPDTGGTA